MRVGYSRECKECGTKFTTHMPYKIFCHKDCQVLWHNKVSGAINAHQKISIGTTGAIAELLVCSDLMTRGYEVFRAVSPSCSIDLMAIKNGQTLMVEVRTGRYSGMGNLYYPKDNRGNQMAIVTHSDRKIHYESEMVSK